ncbi:MAG: hypothetical protein JXJ22_08590 [Bacteroidales bacterium]|nr:hypothetical protein [Bacteroidales bacterium]
MKTTKTIERYLDGEMSGEELKDFMAELKHNDKLAQLVELHKEINESIIDDQLFAFRKNVKYLHTQIQNKKHIDINRNSSFFSRNKIAIAAAITILILFSGALTIFKIGRLSSEEIFSKYYTAYNPDVVVRSENNINGGLHLAIQLYQETDFSTSFEVLQNFIKSNKNDVVANFYLAMNAMELNRMETAIQNFKFIIDNDLQPFVQHAQWYLSLCYLKTDQKELATEQLEQIIAQHSYYFEKAKDLLKSIN